MPSRDAAAVELAVSEHLPGAAGAAASAARTSSSAAFMASLPFHSTFRGGAVRASGAFIAVQCSTMMYTADQKGFQAGGPVGGLQYYRTDYLLRIPLLLTTPHCMEVS